MTDLFEEENDSLEEIVLISTEEFVEAPEEVVVEEALTKADVRKRLDALLEARRLRDELEDYILDDKHLD